MSGLAWRLGLRRSPSGLDTTGTLRYPAQPPEPEQPPAGLYSYGITVGWPDPYGPDPVVFGREPRVRPSE